MNRFKSAPRGSYCVATSATMYKLTNGNDWHHLNGKISNYIQILSSDWAEHREDRPETGREIELVDGEWEYVNE